MYHSATIHFVTDRQTDRQTTLQYRENSRLHCVQQYDITCMSSVLRDTSTLKAGSRRYSLEDKLIDYDKSTGTGSALHFA